MNLGGKVVVVTGGGGGIGAALCRRFARAGARIVAADLDGTAAETVAGQLGGLGLACDVARNADLRAVIERAEAEFGPIALFCSNAGIGSLGRSAEPDDTEWERAWQVNVMAHVRAARLLVPRMAARGGGALLHTVSAAGLLSRIGDAVYSTTKHAAVGFAESLAIAHRDDGIRVSILCPQAVDTAMLRGAAADGGESLDGVLSPDAVAEAAYDGLERGAFCILSHPQVAAYMRAKAENYDRWIGGMAKLRRSLQSPSPRRGEVESAKPTG